MGVKSEMAAMAYLSKKRPGKYLLQRRGPIFRLLEWNYLSPYGVKGWVEFHEVQFGGIGLVAGGKG